MARSPGAVRGAQTRGAGGRAHASRAARGGSARRGLSTREYGLRVTRSWRTANYAYPRGAGADRGRRPSYPIDPRHVRAALSYSARRSTAGTAAHVRYAVRMRYGSVAAALAAARRASR